MKISTIGYTVVLAFLLFGCPEKIIPIVHVPEVVEAPSLIPVVQAVEERAQTIQGKADEIVVAVTTRPAPSSNPLVGMDLVGTQNANIARDAVIEVTAKDIKRIAGQVVKLDVPRLNDQQRKIDDLLNHVGLLNQELSAQARDYEAKLAKAHDDTVQKVTKAREWLWLTCLGFGLLLGIAGPVVCVVLLKNVTWAIYAGLLGAALAGVGLVGPAAVSLIGTITQVVEVLLWIVVGLVLLAVVFVIYRYARSLFIVVKGGEDFKADIEALPSPPGGPSDAVYRKDVLAAYHAAQEAAQNPTGEVAPKGKTETFVKKLVDQAQNIIAKGATP